MMPDDRFTDEARAKLQQWHWRHDPDAPSAIEETQMRLEIVTDLREIIEGGGYDRFVRDLMAAGAAGEEDPEVVEYTLRLARRFKKVIERDAPALAWDDGGESA
jgi:hypothetical protein